MKNHRSKHLMTLVFVITFILSVLPFNGLAAEVIAAGEFGADDNNLSWVLDSNGVLTISGFGYMEDFEGAALYQVEMEDGSSEIQVLSGAPWHKYYESIQDIVIQPGVLNIGTKAFSYCGEAVSVIIPKTVTEIRQQAFYQCGLDSVAIPGSVDSIGEAAFGNCEALSSLTLEEGVHSIGKWSFMGTGLIQLHIPQSVTMIEDGAFQNTNKLTEVTVDDANPKYHAAGNCLIETDARRLIRGSSDGIIPDDGSVTSIARWAYNGCEGITSIRIPETVTHIGYAAFDSCTSLVEVVIPDSVQEIDDWAFNYCTALPQISIPEGVAAIGIGTFDHCYSLERVSLPSTLLSIGDQAFYVCLSLKELKIPAGVTEIGEVAFAVCQELTSIAIPKGVTVLRTNLFASCVKLQEVSLPSEITSIEAGAFFKSGITTLFFSGTEEAWNAIEVGEGNEPLLAADVYWISDDILPTATQYVPYKASLPAASGDSSFALTSGRLPEGLNLSADVLSGIPTELGVFSFTIKETYEEGSTEHKCTLSVYSRMNADVEAYNVTGYGFVETETDNGRVKNQVVSSAKELTDQVMHCEGAYAQFRNVYLDARKLIRDVEYSAEEGSTKITIYAETIGEEGGGTHTLATEFETDDGETVYTVQNYTVAGIASTQVHVTVSGETVIWTDAEPYIDTNSRTMTPFRVVGDALGLTIDWDSTAREASFSDGTKTIYFPIGSTTARTSEGTTVEMDTSAVIVNGRTYAPVRYLAEYFGYGVGWERVTRTVVIE